LGSQARDVGQFLDKLHADLREAEAERLRLKTREHELGTRESPPRAEGRKEQQTKSAKWKRSIEPVRDFEYHAALRPSTKFRIARAQKLSKETERRIARLRREFSEQFDSTLVAHSTGSGKNDPNAQREVVKHAAAGDTVKLKSTGRPQRSCAKSTTTISKCKWAR